MEKLITETTETSERGKRLLDGLELELHKMEERNPRRKEKSYSDPRDPKYIVLKNFLEKAKIDGFDQTYMGLTDIEKHAIVTRLENCAYHKILSFEEVEKFRRDLYGVTTDNEGDEWINFRRQEELDQKIYGREHIDSTDKSKD